MVLPCYIRIECTWFQSHCDFYVSAAQVQGVEISVYHANAAVFWLHDILRQRLSCSFVLSIYRSMVKLSSSRSSSGITMGTARWVDLALSEAGGNRWLHCASVYAYDFRSISDLWHVASSIALKVIQSEVFPLSVAVLPGPLLTWLMRWERDHTGCVSAQPWAVALPSRSQCQRWTRGNSRWYGEHFRSDGRTWSD